MNNRKIWTYTTRSPGPEATVTTIWKTAICKRDLSKWGILKCFISHVLNFRGWIKLIYDKITLTYSVKNEFNPTSEVQNIGNGAFQNAPFANGSFPNGGYSCLWAQIFHCAHHHVRNRKDGFWVELSMVMHLKFCQMKRRRDKWPGWRESDKFS